MTSVVHDDLRTFQDDMGNEYRAPYWFGAIPSAIVAVVEKRGSFRNMRLSTSYGDYDVGVYVNKEGGVGVEMDMGPFDALILLASRGEMIAPWGVAEDEDNVVAVAFRLRSFQFMEEMGGPDVVVEGKRRFPVTNRDKIAVKMGVVPPVVHQILDFVEHECV